MVPRYTPSEIFNWFDHIRVSNDQADRFIKIREEGRALAQTIVDNTQPSPEQDEALKKVREAVMWANSAIRCNER